MKFSENSFGLILTRQTNVFYSQKYLLTSSIILQLSILLDTIVDSTSIIDYDPLAYSCPFHSIEQGLLGAGEARGYYRFFVWQLRNHRLRLGREMTGGVGGLHLMWISPTCWTSQNTDFWVVLCP